MGLDVITVSVLVVAVLVALSEDWLGQLRTWIDAKVRA